MNLHRYYIQQEISSQNRHVVLLRDVPVQMSTKAFSLIMLPVLGYTIQFKHRSTLTETTDPLQIQEWKGAIGQKYSTCRRKFGFKS